MVREIMNEVETRCAQPYPYGQVEMAGGVAADARTLRERQTPRGDTEEAQVALAAGLHPRAGLLIRYLRRTNHGVRHLGSGLYGQLLHHGGRVVLVGGSGLFGYDDAKAGGRLPLVTVLAYTARTM